MRNFIVVLLSIAPFACLAQTTYTFTGNGNWTVSSNWSNNTIPPSILPAGSTINISTNPGSSCILNTMQTIAAGAFLNVTTGSSFIISGGILNNPIIVNDSTILTKLILIDTTNTPGNDTLSILEYHYDTKKRIESIVMTEYYNMPGAEGDVTSYEYSGNDTFPYKQIENGGYSHYLFYNGNNKLIKDSGNINYSTDEMPDRTDNYSYSGDSIFIKTEFYYFGHNVLLDTIFRFFSNNNVVQQLAASGNYGYTFSLDTHPNPMYSPTNSEFGYPVFSGDSTFDMPQQKNNYTEIFSTESGGTHNKYIYQYVYKQNGYPAYFRSYNISTGLPVYAGTGVYKYTRL